MYPYPFSKSFSHQRFGMMCILKISKIWDKIWDRRAHTETDTQKHRQTHTHTAVFIELLPWLKNNLGKLYEIIA